MYITTRNKFSTKLLIIPLGDKAHGCRRCQEQGKKLSFFLPKLFPSVNIHIYLLESLILKWIESLECPCNGVKGILHQKIFYRINLIFWIVMGCGIVRFGRKSLKTTEIWKFWSQNLSPGVSRRSKGGVSRHSNMGFRGAAEGFRGTATWGFEGQQHGTWRHSNTDRTPQWFIISCCPSRSHLITRDLEGWYHR